MKYLYPGSMNRNSGALGAFIAIAVVVLALGLGLITYNYVKLEPVTLTINQKEPVSKSGGGHDYRIYTSSGTFVMKNSWVRLRFDTADEYGRLREGSTYRCKAYGFRIPLFSRFENLIGCEGAR